MKSAIEVVMYALLAAFLVYDIWLFIVVMTNWNAPTAGRSFEKWLDEVARAAEARGLGFDRPCPDEAPAEYASYLGDFYAGLSPQQVADALRDGAGQSQ